MENEIYLDNAATTPIDSDAARLAYDIMTAEYGNPSSAHAKGLEAEHILKKARLAVMTSLGYTQKDGSLIFTSCGTEANNTALFGAYKLYSKRKNNIVISDSEHPGVNVCAKELEKLGVEIRRIPTLYGKLDLEKASELIDEKTMIISCMTVNNETGAIYDIKKLCMLRNRLAPEALVHTDAVQAFTKLPYSLSTLGADLISVSGHKIYAPKGVGALFIKKGVRLPAFIYGGGQEGALRSGTENLAGIGAFGLCCETAQKDMQSRLSHFKALKEYAVSKLQSTCPFILFNTDVSDTFTNNILSISVPGIRSEICLRFLSERGIFVSAGSACSSKSADNRVLTAFGLDDKRADSTLRISFGIQNSTKDIDRLALSLADAEKSLIHTH